MPEGLVLQGLKVTKADFSAKPGTALRQPVIALLLCGVSTVHGDVLTRDKRRTGSTEPEHGAGNFLRSADAANRGLCRNRFLHLGLAFTEGAVKHFGLDRAGRDTVDARIACLAKRSRLGEADTSELAGDVNRRAGKPMWPPTEELFTMAPPPLRICTGGTLTA